MRFDSPSPGFPIWDERMCQIYGIRMKDFSGEYEAWRRSLHLDDAERVLAALQKALNGEKEFDTHFRIIRRDGGIKRIKASARIARDEAGRAVRMTGINCDITDQCGLGTMPDFVTLD